ASLLIIGRLLYSTMTHCDILLDLLILQQPGDLQRLMMEAGLREWEGLDMEIMTIILSFRNALLFSSE
ncbi:MAG TPA: hypothetical protein DCP74_00575, partial [Bacteroidales bacterium]|nr:hypothetical protein [Bacteroidales bacterium]